MPEQKTDWLTEDQVKLTLPPRLQPWLFDSGSMTKRLRNYAKQGFRVELLNQDWGLPFITEAIYLGIDFQQQVLIREVNLICDEDIIVFGRSIFPAQFFQGEGEKFYHLLNETPIGDLLFAEPTMRRSPLQFSQLAPDSLEYQQATHQLGSYSRFLWSRRSRFYVYDNPLLVTEVFFVEHIN